MRPNTSPLNVQYPCRCGATHNAVFRLFSLNILVCPEVQDDALHFVYEAPPKVSYLLTGERRAVAELRQLDEEVADRDIQPRRRKK